MRFLHLCIKKPDGQVCFLLVNNIERSKEGGMIDCNEKMEFTKKTNS